MRVDCQQSRSGTEQPTRKGYVMTNFSERFPGKAANFDQDGLNDVLDILVSEEEHVHETVKHLRERPRLLARRLFRLNRYQRAALSEMSDEDLKELVAPIADALAGGDATRVRLNLRERVTTQSPLSIRCYVEIET
jgi:hypothetical protein